MRKMRDSGVEWIGEVPEGWEVRRLRYIAMSFRKGAGITKADVIADGDIACIRYGDIYSKYKNDVAVVKCLSRTDKNLVVSPQQIFKGEILFSCTGELIEEIGKNIAYMGDEECLAGGDIIIVGHNQNPVFLSYALNSYAQTQKSHDKAKLKVVHISTEGIKDLLICLPSLPEQRRIADYLDEKCAAIDGAVGELKRGIEDCKAWKKAIIFEAVTGKVNVLAASACAKATADKKNAKVAKRQMRDSGIPWIGEIPEGWEVSRVKNECINFDSLREPISAENRENKQGLYDYYGASGVIDKIDDYNVDDTVLLIGEDGANLRMRNLPLVYKATGKFWVNNHAHILKPKEGRDYDFMAYALEAGDYNDFITGSAQPKLSQANLMAYPIALPPLPEQQAIADYLDEKCAAIDALVAEKEKLIADLETYKKSLIFELVTGKREVA